jgi:hypothetical protein
VDIPGESYPMSMALLENFLYVGDRYGTGHRRILFADGKVFMPIRIQLSILKLIRIWIRLSIENILELFE